jgi:hypothetical protein
MAALRRHRRQRVLLGKLFDDRDRLVFWWAVSTAHWGSACDIGCSSETGWGSTIGASGCSGGNDGRRILIIS